MADYEERKGSAVVVPFRRNKENLETEQQGKDRSSFIADMVALQKEWLDCQLAANYTLMAMATSFWNLSMGFNNRVTEPGNDHVPYMTPDDFFSFLPLERSFLEKSGETLLARLLPEDLVGKNAHSIIPLSIFQEVRLDVETPGEKFSIYTGSRSGEGLRYSFYNYEDKFMMYKIAEVREFDQEKRHSAPLKIEMGMMSDFLCFVVRSMNKAISQRRTLDKISMPQRDLGEGEHLALVSE